MATSLGGNSKDFGLGIVMRVVHGLGLPGSSSHRNGTEAEVWSGGVSIPDGSGEGLGEIENRGSFGVELGSDSASDPITLSV